VRMGPALTITSLVRGGAEVRMVRLHDDRGLDERCVLEVSGWPVAQDRPPDAAGGTVRGDRLTATIAGLDRVFVRRERGTSPLGEHVAVPVARTGGPPQPGVLYLTVVILGDAAAPEISAAADGAVHVRWADGTTSTLRAGG
jgi:hypothetical protein